MTQVGKDQPRVSLNVRSEGEKFYLRGEEDWPIPRTEWTKFYLKSDGHLLSPQEQVGEENISYKSTGDGVTFVSNPMEKDTEFCGPIASKIWVSSDTKDADLFLVVRVFTPDF